jgi:hypothetical protein
MKQHLTLIKILVIASIAALAAAATVTPMPEAPSNWGTPSQQLVRSAISQAWCCYS